MAGTLVLSAANCDLILYSAFKVISGCEAKIANAIYFSTETLQLKKTIIRRILKISNISNETEIVERIINAAELAQSQRNELSHALLQTKGDQLMRINARNQGQPGKALTQKYLDGLWKISSQAHVDALKAFQELCDSRKISPSITHE